MLLPDINVWLALTFDSHRHHPAAKDWFDGLRDQSCWFCRFTQQGFLRLASNPKLFGKHALNLRQAWESYDAYRSDPRVSFASEPSGIEVHWRLLTQLSTLSPNVWSDAYLAAFAKAKAWRVVTFDKGFTKFKSIDSLILP
jgi:uncharacterized protein